jgi:hypothetical protein
VEVKLMSLQQRVRRKTFKSCIEYELMKCYKSRTYLVKDENCNIHGYSHNILNTRKNVNDTGQAEMHTAEQLKPQPNFSEAEISTEKME